ncbi:MAG TPA: hypothetical protein VMZ27_10360 [Candidatus Saccharimonadales bacterium]|nr:hypothetical protein [Candidatus Saccharimonadales bacterium]
MKNSMKEQPVPDWLSVKEAAAYLSTSTTTIRRLRATLDPATRRPYLTSCQPSPKLVLISGASLKAHRDAAQDLEFWEGRKLAGGKIQPLLTRKEVCRQGKTKLQKRNSRLKYPIRHS